MAELEDKLNAILGNPEAMGQIVNIAKALTSESGAATPAQQGTEQAQPPPEQPEYVPVEPEAADAPQQSALPPAAPAPPPPQGEGQQLDLGAIMSLLSSLTGGSGTGQSGGGSAAAPSNPLDGLDPKLIQTAVTLFSEYSATDDKKIALLSALRPFLKEERFAKMDKAIQIAKLSRVIRVAFQLFKQEGGGADV